MTTIWSDDGGDHVHGHMIVYVGIGNSDDKLPQAKWSAFCGDLQTELNQIYNGQIHGVWYSSPLSPYQNMCVCVELPELYTSAPEIYLEGLKNQLRDLAKTYGQDSISWAEVGNQQFLGEGVPDA